MYFIKASIASIEYTNDGDWTRPLYKKKNYKIRTEKAGLESALVLSGNNLHGFLGRFSRQPLGSEGSRGSQRTQEAAGWRSQAYLLGPLDFLHGCCV